MKTPSVADLERNYLAGVEAVEEIVAPFGPNDWEGPGCGKWTAVETVRHLVGVIDWYAEWLDRALRGVHDRPFNVAEFERRNDDAINDRKNLDGVAATSEFGSKARRYLDRALNHLDVPFGYPAGTVTVGLHLGVAAAEWHLHAWDLASGRRLAYEPDDATSLFLGAGACVVATKGGVSGRLLGLAVPIAAKRSPWKTMLKESGR